MLKGPKRGFVVVVVLVKSIFEYFRINSLIMKIWDLSLSVSYKEPLTAVICSGRFLHYFLTASNAKGS